MVTKTFCCCKSMSRVSAILATLPRVVTTKVLSVSTDFLYKVMYAYMFLASHGYTNIYLKRDII